MMLILVNKHYTGSTNNLELRLHQHLNGEGAVYTRTRLPVELLYFEQFSRIDDAFFREKQVQGWSRKKKEALINDMSDDLHELAKCMNESSHVGYEKLDVDSGGFDSAQPPEGNGSDGFGFAQPPGEE